MSALRQIFFPLLKVNGADLQSIGHITRSTNQWLILSSCFVPVPFFPSFLVLFSALHRFLCLLLTSVPGPWALNLKSFLTIESLCNFFKRGKTFTSFQDKIHSQILKKWFMFQDLFYIKMTTLWSCTCTQWIKMVFFFFFYMWGAQGHCASTFHLI